VEQKKVNYFLFFFSQVRRGLVDKLTGVILSSCVSGQNFTGVIHYTPVNLLYQVQQVIQQKKVGLSTNLSFQTQNMNTNNLYSKYM
jgi:hypothetical protein